MTGATGTVGSEVVRLLREEGHPVRAATRNIESVDSRLKDGLVERVRFDFARPETYRPALQGVTQLFLVRPPAISDTKRYINPAIDAAKQAGVEHVVFLSLLGAEKNPVVPHRKIETYLEASGLAYTFLRASFFMQNLSTTHREEIRDRSEVFVPAGRGKTSFVDARDIAAVAVKTLTEPWHGGRSCPLTGDEALDYGEVARTLSEVLGREVVYADPSIPRFVARMRKRGFPWDFILVMVGICTTARLGLAAGVTPDTARLLDRAPTTMREFAEDHADLWR